LARLEVAGGIAFEIWLVAAQSILTNVALTRSEIWDDDAGVVTAFPADDLATGQRVDSSETSTIRQAAVNPTSF
jgi:hypothetical protein